ncbi:MAG TPA: serine/threonine-protein kinase, partial [Nannocystaceae bacterium]|nr:serine/threonine-protein kinase [Nannocystaceae bacterium]
MVAVDDETLTGVVRRRSSASSTPERGLAVERALPSALTERYMLLARIGAGGMGVVYEAHDRELDRRLAIKLLRPGAARTHARRLLREAQTLARLSHPNLVPVFDVGSVGDDVFVAMELVRGHSLDRIAVDERVPWPERLRMLVDAGRGLAHAHECGLVHRDVKPSNVLVGDDGRARVADFGLARPLRLASAELDEGDATPATPAPHAITRPGRLAGTPAYMPPELLHGASFDEKSDQFSFCVCAWEVLHGVRPRRDRSDGAAILPSTPSPLPRRVQAALRRGMAVDPAARHASMAALLDALQPARHRSLALGIAVVAITGAAIAVVPDTHCDDVADELAWNDARAHELRARIADVGVADGAALYDAIATPLDRYAAAWTRARGDACRAARSTACFDERRDAADALVDTLLQTDRRAVLLAGPAAIAELSTLDACANDATPSLA